MPDQTLCLIIESESADKTDIVLASNDFTNKNLYQYSDNNPINCYDENGTFAITGAMVTGAVLNLGISWLSAAVTGQEFTLWDGFVAVVLGGMAPISSEWLVRAAVLNGLNSFALSSLEGENMFVSLLSASISGVSSLCTLIVLPKSMALNDELTETVFDAVIGTGINLSSTMADMVVKSEPIKTTSSKSKKYNSYANSIFKTYGNSYVVRSTYSATARYVV